MQPQFPEFKKIELEDRLDIEELTTGFPPYAEFNFIEIWSWMSREHGGWTCLNGNLVFRWHDLETEDIFLTMIGRSHVSKTMHTLIDFALESGIDSRLLAVPQSVVDALDPTDDEFDIQDDRMYWDYVLSTQEWSTMSGARFKNKRNAIHRLERNHQPELREIDLTIPKNRSDVLRVAMLWAALRNRTTAITRFELDAIRNVLSFATLQPCNGLHVVGAYVNDELIGFSINEELRDGFGLGHFAKADYRYEGVYSYLLRQVARHMLSRGVLYLNIEADLGDPGLAHSKRLCHPVEMLRKYSISRRSDASRVASAAGSALLNTAGGERSL